jgi:hypothetical protein
MTQLTCIHCEFRFEFDENQPALQQYIERHAHPSIVVSCPICDHMAATISVETVRRVTIEPRESPEENYMNGLSALFG